ncbi:COR domain-containing protein [Anabaena lutea]|uniref:non-specific serine/threonine protein kinase n=1 Tax=Anabaena lutea FACHB-196 TaxID=2692881 RepID=A0ABR8FDM9_9NOST|nr:COR domain-containing protein [Anabaena lutea]MBD2567292.1 leucine-rich repeat domain-containing protein [Anabaena lutea FACHB-196]
MTEAELLQAIEQAARDGVTKLNLTGNQLSRLPREIVKLSNLQFLNLSSNQLSGLPREIVKLTNLQSLYLSGNQLSSLPLEILKLTNLQSLYLSNNQLRNLPAEIGQLTNIQSLYLSGNQLSGLPREIGQLTNLQSLYLSGNQLSGLPREIVKLTNLQSLYLSGNQLSSLPLEILNLTNLQSLDFSNNQLNNLPREILKLTNLQSLYLSSNRLSSLPREIVELTNLQTLDFSNNQLNNLPREILKFTNLQSLYLSSNQLSSLPAEIGQLSNLQSLYLSSNQLSSLPAEIGQLSNLQSLYLSRNQLSSLPAEIGQLSNLQTLDLSRNQLSSLPAEIGQLSKLKRLELRDNEISNLPPEIREKGLKAILNFYRQQLEQAVERLYEAKFLIVGEGGAGKTSLAKKIENENYELLSDEKSTEGIDVIQWKFNLDDGNEFRVNIWDFGGQEIYHQTHQFFLTKRSLYTLVADTRQDNTDFYYWLKVVELLSDNSPVIIIKNEKQERQCEVNERQLRGEFLNLKEVLATNLATNRGLTVIKDAIQQYIAKLPHVGTPLPKTWVKIRSDLENDSHNYISREKYYNLCRLNNLTNRKDMDLLSGYLHDLGVCLHFQDDPTLKHYVILKPEWGTTAVYKVLDNKKVIKNLGCFTQDNLAEIWKDDEYSDVRDELLQLMMRFKLCYPIPHCYGKYIAPQLLDINQPEYNWDRSHNLILRYKYEFMPKGILTRLIVETHPWIEEQKLAWRSGVILNQYQTRAEVIENYNQKEIKIRVVGSRKKELLTVITHELDKIHRSFERLKYDTLVPCNCKECEGSQTPHAYTLESLRKRLYAGRYQIECENSFEMVDVRRLIDDVNLPTQELNRERQTPVTPLQNELDNQKKESFNVINIHNHVNSESNSMSESYQSKYDQRNANNQFLDTAQSGSNVTFNQNNYTPEQKQNLAEAATEIQQLLHQLSKNNQTSTNEGITNAIHQEIKSNPTLKTRLIAALKAGGLEALKAIFNHPVFSIPAETIKGFLEAE